MKLIINNNITLEELRKKIDYGSRFISFPYCISIFFAVTLRRFSPAIFIPQKEDIVKFKRRYNLITCLLGWWGFPWGPILSIRAIQSVRQGGIDMTEDIMMNIDDDSLALREVELKTTRQLFCKPDKWDTRSFKKSLGKCFEKELDVKKIVVGISINTVNTKRTYNIGFLADSDLAKYIEKAKEPLYKDFKRTTDFRFIDLSENSDITRLLEKQGEEFFKR
jgi:hypothetical protein